MGVPCIKLNITYIYIYIKFIILIVIYFSSNIINHLIKLVFLSLFFISLYIIQIFINKLYKYNFLEDKNMTCSLGSDHEK